MSTDLQSDLPNTVVVISDIHSRQAKLERLLVDIGVLDPTSLERRPGFQIIQVGDAISAGYGMEEAEFYEWWTSLLTDDDVELVGNHEAPILWPYDDRFKFYGYEAGDMGEAGCDPALKPLVLARQDRYRAAHAVDDWLITHAGVMRRFQGEDAASTAEALNALWERHLGPYDPHPWMGCAICDNTRGVLWVRDLEKGGNDARHIKQVFGHTPDGPTLGGDGTVWNIDTRRECGRDLDRKDAESFGGVAALVRRDDEWELFHVA